MSLIGKMMEKEMEKAGDEVAEKVADKLAAKLIDSPAFKEILEKMVEALCDNLKLLTDAGLDMLKDWLVRIIDEKVNEAVNAETKSK